MEQNLPPRGISSPVVQISGVDWTRWPRAGFPLALFSVLRGSTDGRQPPESVCVLMFLKQTRQLMCCFRLAVTILLYQIAAFFGCFQTACLLSEFW